MATRHGKDTCLFYNGYDISGNLSSAELGLELASAEDTSFKDDWRSRLVGQRDATVTAEGFFDAATGGLDSVIWANIGGANGQVSLILDGDTLGNTCYMIDAHHVNYTPSVTVDDVVKASVEFTGTNTVGRGEIIHTLGAETSTGSTTTVDSGASSSSGGHAMIHVTASAGSWGSFDCDIRHSSDNFSADDNSLVAFTQVTADNSSERVTFSGTVQRYLRLDITLTTITSVTFWVGLHRD